VDRRAAESNRSFVSRVLVSLAASKLQIHAYVTGEANVNRDRAVLVAFHVAVQICGGVKEDCNLGLSAAAVEKVAAGDGPGARRAAMPGLAVGVERLVNRVHYRAATLQRREGRRLKR
jgi:hypothetical protein